MIYPDKNNFAPRIGFAWDVLGNAKLVMRGGFGIFYDIEDGALNLQFGGQPPFGDVSNLNYSGFSPGFDPIADPFNSFNPGTVNPFPFIAGGRLGQFFVPKVSFAFVVIHTSAHPTRELLRVQYQLTKIRCLRLTCRQPAEADHFGDVNPAFILKTQFDFSVLLADCARALAVARSGDPNFH